MVSKTLNIDYDEIYHAQLWHAIDRIAETRKVSVSKLAQMANLDPTSFNKSKRKMKNGKMRWPSTESILKIIQAANVTLEEFISYIKEPPFKVLNDDTE
jgi:phage repressor protein C with HTH and peptisase S24 domain